MREVTVEMIHRLLGLTMILAGMLSLTNTARSGEITNSDLRRSAEDLHSGEIVWVEIIARALGTLTPARIEPSSLLLVRHSHCEFLMDSEMGALFAKQIVRAKFEPSPHAVDLHWRVQLYNGAGVPLHTLYLGRSYQNSPVVGMEMSGEFLEGDRSLLDWFESLDMKSCRSRHW